MKASPMNIPMMKCSASWQESNRVPAIRWQPAYLIKPGRKMWKRQRPGTSATSPALVSRHRLRSEEHTSELQSRFDLVCRLLLEKKKKKKMHKDIEVNEYK